MPVSHLRWTSDSDPSLRSGRQSTAHNKVPLTCEMRHLGDANRAIAGGRELRYAIHRHTVALARQSEALSVVGGVENVATAPAETAAKQMTADEFARLPDALGKQELVRGEVVVNRPPSEEHAVMQLDLGARMLAHAKAHRLGRVMTEAGFLLRTGPDVVRLPDVAFIATDRFPPGAPRLGHIAGYPDLAVEILSAGDTQMDVDEKVEEYLDAGTRLVWVVNPRTRTIRVHLPNRSAQTLRGADVLSGGDVFPGFSVRLDELFSA